MHFRDETTNVLIGGYLSEQAAREDYDAVLNCGERIWGAAVVSKDLKGNVTVDESDHAVTEAATGMAGVGFVIGLFAPPLLAATVLGAALGAAGGAVAAQEDRRGDRGDRRGDHPDRRGRPARVLPARARRHGRSPPSDARSRRSSDRPRAATSTRSRVRWPPAVLSGATARRRASPA